MDSISLEIKDVDKELQRSEVSPEDKIVSPYLENRSEACRDLVKLRNDAWNNPIAAAYFKRQRRKVDGPKLKDRMDFFFMMRKIGDEIDAANGNALKLPYSNARVLDLCMAPGGFSASSLKHSPHAVICACTSARQIK